jgi:hypothetical protein
MEIPGASTKPLFSRAVLQMLFATGTVTIPGGPKIESSSSAPVDSGKSNDGSRSVWREHQDQMNCEINHLFAVVMEI